MKDRFLICFTPFVAIAPAYPAENWLDFVEQCYQLARELGRGEYLITDESPLCRDHKFWI